VSDHVEELARVISDAVIFLYPSDTQRIARAIIAAGWRPAETTTATLQRRVDEDRKRWNEQWRSEQ